MWYTSPNFRYGVLAAGAGGGVFYYANLERVPGTGRVRFNVISEEYVKKSADGQDRLIIQQFGPKVLPPNHPHSQMVDRVIKRLILAAGLSSEGWTVRVIDDQDQANAFVMPGGTVYVFSGILPIAENDDGLAAVLSHEISHNVAHHRAETLSSYGLLVLFAWSIQGLFDKSGNLTYFLLNTLLTLPNSRAQEVSQFQRTGHLGLCHFANTLLKVRSRLPRSQ